MTDTTEQTRPRIWNQSTVYMAEIRGKLHTSSSYESLAELAGITTAAQEAEAARLAAQVKEQTDARQAAADKIPAAEAKATETAEARTAAQEAFTEAVAADPVWQAYATLLAATKADNTAPYHVQEARAASIGRIPGSGSHVLPALLPTLEAALTAPTSLPGTVMAESPALDGAR